MECPRGNETLCEGHVSKGALRALGALLTSFPDPIAAALFELFEIAVFPSTKN